MIKERIKIPSIIQAVHQKGFFNLLSANVFIQIVAFASQLFVAGILSPAEIGSIKILQTFLSIFTLIGGLGFNNSVLKLCSENIEENDKKILFNAGLGFTLFSTLFTYLVLISVNSFGVISSDNLIRSLFPIALFPLITTSLFSVYTSYFLAQRKIRLLSRLTSVNKLIAIIGIIIFTYFLGIKGYYIAYNISFILVLMICLRKEPLADKKTLAEIYKNKKALFKTHWLYAKPSLGAVVIAEFAAFADIILINYLVEDKYQIGFYSFALTLTVIVRFIPSTVQLISEPYFSALSNNKNDIITAYKKYLRLLLIIITATLIAVLIIVPPAINWIYQRKYATVMIYFTPLAIGWSIRQINQLQSAVLFGMGKMSHIAYSQFFSLISNTVILLIALYYFGAIGAAYASIPSNVLSVFILYLFLRKNLK